MPDVIDLREPEHQGKPISSFRPGQKLTGYNGTDTVWIVNKQRGLKKVQDGTA
jgi:hypothetical protein